MTGDAPRRLGRGLEALISTAKLQHESSRSANTPRAPISDLQTIRIADIVPNPYQPRKSFSDVDIAELETSIRSAGLLQPITVRAHDHGWQLVAGERRLRATTKLGWTEIPAIVRDFDDRTMLTLALVENLQRSDLNAIEEAEGYQRLINEFELTQQQVAEAVGKDRTTITNMLRMLALPVTVRKMVEQSHLTAGHARALLVLKTEKQQIEMAGAVIAGGLSVRETESRIREINSLGLPASSASIRQATRQNKADPAARRIEEQLRRRLQTDVSIQHGEGTRGVVRISFYSPDDLERVLDIVLGPNRSDFE